MGRKPVGLLEELGALLEDVHSESPSQGAAWDLFDSGGPVREVLERKDREATESPQSDGRPYLPKLKERVPIMEFMAGAMVGHLYDRLSEVALHELQSPIEEGLLFGIILAAWKASAGIEIGVDGTTKNAVDVSLVASSGDFYRVIPQAEVAGLHPDFTVHGRFYCVHKEGADPWIRASVVVECDGHDYHERTKEQAKRDKSRDRRLLGIGMPVMRFTGSEIFSRPILAAEGVLKILRNNAWQREYTERFRDEAVFRSYAADPHWAGMVTRDSGLSMGEWAKRLGYGWKEQG